MPEDDFSQETRIRRLEERFKRFTILAGPDIDVAGSIGEGYAVNLTRRGGATQVTGPTGPTGPPPPNTGACCFEDNSCLVLTADDCSNAGGIYEGDDVPCDPNPCGVCPELTLLCDSINASKSKCGIPAYDGSNPVYLVETTTYSGHCTQSCPNHCNGTCSQALDADSGTVTTANYDSLTCGNTGSGCSAEIFATSCGGFPVSTGFFGCDISDSYLTSTTATTKDWLRFFIGEGCTNCGTVTCAHDPDPSGPPYSGPYDCPDNSCTYTKNVTLSSEYTTSELISNTEAALPAYFGHMGCEENEEIGFRGDGQNCVCFASRELSEDERSYAINRFKYQFTFAAATAPFTITWNEHTEFDDMTTSDNPMSASVGIGDTETDIFEVLEPSANGTTSITDVECTLD